MGIKLTARYYLKQIAQKLVLQQAVFYLNRLIFVSANILIIFTITSKKSNYLLKQFTIFLIS